MPNPALSQLQNLVQAYKNPDQIDPDDPDQVAAQKQLGDMTNSAMNIGMGTLQTPEIGALSKLAGAGEQAGVGIAENAGATAVDNAPQEMSLYDRIQLAKQKSNVQVEPTFEQAANEQLKQQYANQPKNFFDNSRVVASQKGIGPSMMEQEQMAVQKQARQDMINQRNADQIQAAQNRWKKLTGGQQ